MEKKYSFPPQNGFASAKDRSELYSDEAEISLDGDLLLIKFIDDDPTFLKVPVDTFLSFVDEMSREDLEAPISIIYDIPSRDVLNRYNEEVSTDCFSVQRKMDFVSFDIPEESIEFLIAFEQLTYFSELLQKERGG